MTQIHSYWMARAVERAAFAEEAAQLAPEVARIARKYGIAPSTVAKVAAVRAREIEA